MRKLWFFVGLATIIVVLLVVGAIYFFQGEQEEEEPISTSAQPMPSPSEQQAWESVYIPGYDSNPDPFVLTDPADASGETITANFAFDPSGVNPAGALGLSFDATDLASEVWDSPESNLALTLHELDSPVLRFGGNGVDRRMWWTSSDESAPDWAEATVTPADLERVAVVAEAVDASITVVLDLGHDDAERAADMALYAQQAFGDRLLAVTVGNEPNGFYHPNQPQLEVRDEDWGPEAYQESLIEYTEAIEAVAPGLQIAGPGAYDAPWWRAFAEADISQSEALSFHWYPLWDCEGPDSSIANPTVEDLTSPAIRDRAEHIIGMARDVADAHGLPLWLEETGPTSCPGTNETSRTHAQALWTVDFVLTSMSAGVERMAFHSTLNACEGGAPMSPVCGLGSYSDPGQIIGARTSFQALMMMGWLPEGTVLTPDVSGDGEVMTHAVLGEDGELAIVVVDLRDPEETEDLAQVDLHAPSGSNDIPSAWRLSQGASLSAETLHEQESSLTALAPIVGEYEDASLDSESALSVGSSPGSVTMLMFEAID